MCSNLMAFFFFACGWVAALMTVLAVRYVDGGKR